jgi:hypothetical protein
MNAANYLLLALGILGGLDILLYHSISHGIRSHHESRYELLTHAMRGPTYAALFFVTPNFEPHGGWAILFALLLLFDISISVADFALESNSRAALGGLPPGEYILHMIMAMLFGAFVATLTPSLWDWSARETALITKPTLAPFWLRLTLPVFALCVLYSGLADLLAALRLASTLPDNKCVADRAH